MWHSHFYLPLYALFTPAPVWAWLPHIRPFVGVASLTLALIWAWLPQPTPVWVWLPHTCYLGVASSTCVGVAELCLPPCGRGFLNPPLWWVWLLCICLRGAVPLQLKEEVLDQTPAWCCHSIFQDVTWKAQALGAHLL